MSSKVPATPPVRTGSSLRMSTDLQWMDTDEAVEMAKAALLKRPRAEVHPSTEQYERDVAGFAQLFQRFRNHHTGLDWHSLQLPRDGHELVPRKSLEPVTDEGETARLLGQLAVVKLNGGLGTTMGCTGPKSLLTVEDGMSFLDITVHQLQRINAKHGVSVPLVLMNSFNTDADTRAAVQKYRNSRFNVEFEMFNQSCYPRIMRDSLMPVSCELNTAADDKDAWYPPGHGNIFQAMSESGVLDKLLLAGKRWAFVSNVDNLGATVDVDMLRHIEAGDHEYVMEVTTKTRADVKGGTLVRGADGRVRLLELAQVPKQHVEEFKSITKFKVFNTNNLWVDLKAVKRLLEEPDQPLMSQVDIIVNHKTYRDSKPVIQLETAVGASIGLFDRAHGVVVPRSRFLPVKSTSDLFLIQSNLYSINKDGVLVINPERPYPTLPLIKLGKHFNKVADYEARFKGRMPDITQLDHLTVSGDVTFGSAMTLRGTVIIVTNDGRIHLPDGSVLENKVVSGSLSVMEH